MEKEILARAYEIALKTKVEVEKTLRESRHALRRNDNKLREGLLEAQLAAVVNCKTACEIVLGTIANCDDKEWDEMYKQYKNAKKFAIQTQLYSILRQAGMFEYRKSKKSVKKNKNVVNR